MSIFVAFFIFTYDFFIHLADNEEEKQNIFEKKLSCKANLIFSSTKKFYQKIERKKKRGIEI